MKNTKLKYRHFLLASLVLFYPAEKGAAEDSPPEGLVVYKTYCSPCHSINPPPKLAPPMRGIVMHYRPDADSPEELAALIHTWINSPQADHTRIPGAISRFNLMPPMPVERSKIDKLADWLWSCFVTRADAGNCSDPAVTAP